MSDSPLEPDATNIEDIESAQIKDDLGRSPEEKVNREQSAASDAAPADELPRADAVPPPGDDPAAGLMAPGPAGTPSN